MDELFERNLGERVEAQEYSDGSRIGGAVPGATAKEGFYLG